MRLSVVFWCWVSMSSFHLLCHLQPAQPSQPSPAQQPTKPGHSNLSCNLIFTRLHAHSFYALSIAWTNFQLFSSHQCSGQLTLNTVITHFQTSQSWQHFCHKTQNITMKLTLKSTSIWKTRKMHHFQIDFLNMSSRIFETWGYGSGRFCALLLWMAELSNALQEVQPWLLLHALFERTSRL